jgi:flavorubredoxin
MQKAIIIYETRTGNTKQLAGIIQESMKQSGVEVDLKRIDDVDVNGLSDYAAVILGSPTYHKDMIGTMKTFLFKLEKVDLRGKIGAAFGAWGWSGEAVEMLSETMKNIYEMDIVEPRGRLLGNTGAAGQHQAFGQKIAEKIKESKK